MYNSTIKQKMGICPLCNDQNEKPLKKGLCHIHYWNSVRMRSVEKQSIKAIEDDGLSALIHDADVVFSRFIRLSNADRNGIVKCYTCGSAKPWSSMQCGHYIKRGNLYLRWDPRNARPQCSICNEYKHGNYLEFTKSLERDFPGITEILMEEARIVYKPTRAEIQGVIDEFSLKIKIISESRNK